MADVRIWGLTPLASPSSDNWVEIQADADGASARSQLHKMGAQYVGTEAVGATGPNAVLTLPVSRDPLLVQYGNGILLRSQWNRVGTALTITPIGGVTAGVECDIYM